MEPTHQTNVTTPSSDDEKFKKGDGSLKLKTRRPRSRTGSGGILRVDVSKSTFISTELRQAEPSSPQPSVDRLSVTFATEERSICSSDASVKLNFYAPPSTPPISCMEKVRFPTITDGEDDTEEDYSASVTAIMQRRASTRKSRRKSRRTSSPFSHDQDGLQVRRRSSCFTTSSGDTAISMEESLPQEVTQEQIFENIRLHKEVLSSVKMQPWVMKRKLKLVQQAKSYIKRHQGVLQERLAQSRSTRDILARWNIYLVQKLQHFRRELANLSNLLIPWESRIKEIESHFGSVVASYFTFLRWLFWVNLIISVVLVAFVAIPELLTADPKSAGGRKVILPEEKEKATNLFTLWDFEGVLKYSPLFYGYYTDKNGTGKGYRLPLAYFMTGLGVYVYSFVATLRKMAENSRMSKLSEKDDECVFSWKLFTGWDYMIGNAETAQNRVASIILGFKEALLEEAEKKREPRNWKVIGARVLVNLMVLGLLAISAYAVVEVVQRSTHKDAGKSFWRRNEITVVMSLISFLFPMFFEGLGYFEHYHPRKQLRLQLARIMVLNMLNLYSLIFALFDKIKDMTRELQTFKNTSHYEEITTQFSIEVSESCFEIYEDCRNVTTYPELSSASLISVLGNISMGLLLTNINQTQKIPKIFNTTLQNIANFTNGTDDFDLLNERVENFLYNITNSTFEENYEIVDYNSSFDEKYENFTNSNFTNNNFTNNSFTNNNISMKNAAEYYVTELYNETGTDYYGNENDAYPDDDIYFNFDYSTLDFSITNDETKNNSTEEISNITSTIDYSILNETAMNNFTTENIVTTLLPLLNITFDTTSAEDIVTTLLPFLNITLNEDDNTSAEFSTLQSILNETITKLNQTMSNEPKPQCKIKKCYPVKLLTPETTTDLTPFEKEQQMKLDYKQRKRLRKLCWETMFGQELVKLTVMDLSFTIISIMAVDFVRAIFVRVMNNCWCWDLEKKFPQYGDFKIAENILHLVNNQGMVWMGMFFSPGITVINLIKLAIMMYLRSWAVLTCNVPHEVVFRASRSNNFYLALLLTMLFLCVLPVGYAIVWIEPSWHCGPFSNYNRIYHIFTKSLKHALPKALHQTLDYIASPFIVIPLLVLLILIIYYMISLTNALREANNDLKLQLRRERTEERRKMFQIADRRRRNGSGDSGDDSTPFGKWKKLLPMLPNSKSFDADTSGKDNDVPDEKAENNKNKDFLAKFIKRAIKNKPQDTETIKAPPTDDATDTEQHDSLPDDANTRDTKTEDETRVLNNFRKLLNAKAKQNKEKSNANNEKDAKSKSVPSNNARKPKTVNKSNTTPTEKFKSTSRSSSSKDLRQDSLTSNWSDNIPVIKISGTGSSECILETQNEIGSSKSKTQNNKPRKIMHQSHIDIETRSDDDVPGSELQIAEPQCATANSSSETLVTVKLEELETLIEHEQELNNLAANDLNKSKEKSSVDTQQSVEMQKSTSNSDSTHTSAQTKTESSTDYKE